MSKIKAALVTMFVLATSSAAMATPGVTVSARANFGWSWNTPVPTIRPTHPVRSMPPAPQVRDHRDSFDDYTPQAQSWILLGTVDQVVAPEAALDFSIPRYRSISKITLQSNGGKSRIMDVKINFANGTTNTIQLDRYVGQKGTINLPASPSYTIDLQESCHTTSKVVSITIDGLNATNSSYSVYAL